MTIVGRLWLEWRAQLPSKLALCRLCSARQHLQLGTRAVRAAHADTRAGPAGCAARHGAVAKRRLEARNPRPTRAWLPCRAPGSLRNEWLKTSPPLAGRSASRTGCVSPWPGACPPSRRRDPAASPAPRVWLSSRYAPLDSLGVNCTANVGGSVFIHSADPTMRTARETSSTCLHRDPASDIPPSTHTARPIRKAEIPKEIQSDMTVSTCSRTPVV
jgi:hypothetical protein